MFFRLFSDIHLEFGPFEIPHLDTDKDTILVLAGDIAVASKPSQYFEFITDACQRFNHVIWIPGNHEHYHGSILRSMEKMKRAVGHLENLSIVNNETVLFEQCNTAFVCSTMWTDMANGNPMIMYDAERCMNDYNLIRTGTPGVPYQRRLLASDTYKEHLDAIKYIKTAIQQEKEFGRQVVVVTHHAPSYQSIHDDYRSDRLNPAYCSPLDSLIEELAPDYWCHGHIHQGQDYHIGTTNVIANPRGYVGHEHVRYFEPDWIIEL